MAHQKGVTVARVTESSFKVASLRVLRWVVNSASCLSLAARRLDFSYAATNSSILTAKGGFQEACQPSEKRVQGWQGMLSSTKQLRCLKESKLPRRSPKQIKVKVFGPNNSAYSLLSPGESHNPHASMHSHTSQLYVVRFHTSKVISPFRARDAGQNECGSEPMLGTGLHVSARAGVRTCRRGLRAW